MIVTRKPVVKKEFKGGVCVGKTRVVINKIWRVRNGRIHILNLRRQCIFADDLVRRKSAPAFSQNSVSVTD